MVGRIILGFLIIAAIAGLGWGGWIFARSQASAGPVMAAQGPIAPASASQFRVTICASTPCTLVEAGGLAFLVGAGEGAAEALSQRGLLRPDLDAVLLTDLSHESIAGLPAIRNATWFAGRREPLTVFGPAGLGGVVDGVNLMQTGSDAREVAAHSPDILPPAAAALIPGVAVAASPGGGSTIFDSGVVSISSFPVARPTGGVDWLYRFDFEDETLLVAGCAARAADLARAVRGARRASAVLPAALPALIEDRRKAAAEAKLERSIRFLAAPVRDCLTPETAVAAYSEARLAGGILAPLYPPADTSIALRNWETAITAPAALKLAVGQSGAQLDLLVQIRAAPTKPANTPLNP